MDNKEKWIEDTLEMTSSVQMAELPATIVENVLKRLPSIEREIVSLQPYTKWTIAASIALLIVLNSFTCIKFAKRGNQSSTENQENMMYTTYFSFVN